LILNHYLMDFVVVLLFRNPKSFHEGTMLKNAMSILMAAPALKKLLVTTPRCLRFLDPLERLFNSAGLIETPQIKCC